MITVDELREMRGNYCECCGVRQGTQRHHVFYRRSKNHKEYDHEYNLCLVCVDCHTVSNRVDNREFRQSFWTMQSIRYGNEFIEWYENVPTKSIKERYE